MFVEDTRKAIDSRARQIIFGTILTVKDSLMYDGCTEIVLDSGYSILLSEVEMTQIKAK